MKNIKRHSKQQKTRLAISIIILSLFIAAILFVVIYFWPYISALLRNDEEVRNELLTIFESYGSYAWAIILGCCMFQVIFAVLPNGVFELIAGLMYGPFVGVVISLVGNTLGCLIVLFLVRIFGKGFASYFVDIENNKKFSVLKDEKRCLIMIFGLLFIPALPKDFIVFLVPFMNVRIRYFLLVNLIARTPTTVMSVYFGDSLMTGNMALAFTIGSIAAVIGICCLIFNKQIEKFLTDKVFKSNNKETL